MTWFESFWASMMVKNRNPGPPESDSRSPTVPAANIASVPAHNSRLAPLVLFSKVIFRRAEVVVSTGIPVTRYFPLLPTVPVIVIVCCAPFRAEIVYLERGPEYMYYSVQKPGLAAVGPVVNLQR